MRHAATLLAAAVLLTAAALPARADVVVYCSADEKICRGLVTLFTKETGIKAEMTRQSSGETYARVRAEKENPRGDVWWAGTGDPHLQAAEEGLTEEYHSPLLPKLRDWAVKQAERAKFRTVGVYMGALGFGYNREELARRKLAAPKCWADLIKPEFKGEVQMADPNSSGTAYTMLATLVQLWGEEKAFDYLKKLNVNINEYTKSGSAPVMAAGQGETMIGVAFQHDVVMVALTGKPLVTVSPCEGTGYEVGSMSLIKGGRNPVDARKFYDWALGVSAQSIMPKFASYQVPSNAAVPVPKEAPDLSTIKLIDYDFAKYGSAAERRRLLARWTTEVKGAPR
ncbi:MAG: ABC transporter substrate-binding protein [Acetobacteraceae bacterium]|nr:ABC transporter substrate-binding protein [Acetobacteraceae bacterium]